jgi:hypothetical protein
MTTMARRLTLAAAVTLTVATAGVWLATGRHYYTKFSSIERIETQIDPDDPLAEAGFYDGPSQIQTIRREGFHLGLLPVPQGLVDKHLLSVATLLIAVWGMAYLIHLLTRPSKSRHTT